MTRRAAAWFLLPTLAALAFAACGSDGGGELPLAGRLTAQAAGGTTQPASPVQPAPPRPTAPSATSTPASAPATAQPTLDALTLGQVNALERLVLGQNEVPAGFTVLRSERAFRRDIVAAQIAIPELARFLQDSTLAGAWGSLYAKATQDGQVALTTIVYLFGTPQDALAFVEANANVQAGDYVAAIEVQQVQGDVIGDAAYFVRYRLVQGRSLEYTWAQGPLAGQVILRYTQDTEDPDDPGNIVGLARMQSVKMAGFLR
jgi:hypothetical protein